MSRLKNVLPLALAAALSSPTFAQVRSYLAGTAGNPSAAPNPTAQGWFLIDPTGGAAVRTDVSPDGSTGRNAWQIDTGSAPGGGQLFYEDFLTQQELDDAFVQGWRMSVVLRPLVTTGTSLGFQYANGMSPTDDRWAVWLRIAGSDVEIANMGDSSQTYICPGGNDGGYHTFAIQKPAGEIDGEVWYDGLRLGPLSREPSSLSAPAGGLGWGAYSAPATAANFHSVRLDLLDSVGTPYCSPALPNSTGTSARMGASGSSIVANNDLVIEASGLPLRSFAYFLTSTSQGLALNPSGSAGNLCLGGQIGRFTGPGQVQFSGTVGAVALPVDLGMHPTSSTPVSVQPGETWNYQCWFRDTDGAGGATSNLSDGLEVNFR
ncbi:MAG: hypothetical protein AAGB93_13200 [Planctomycetota bacterium]